MTAPNTVHDVLDLLDAGGPDDCWTWLGSVKDNGYGSVRMAGKTYTVHRLVYEHLIGPIEEGMELDHLCRNRLCSNPEHLEPVTHQENGRRGLSGFSLTGKCRSGKHGPSQWAHRKSGVRFCQGCRDDRHAEERALLKAAREALGLTAREYRDRYGSTRRAAEEVLGRRMEAS